MERLIRKKTHSDNHKNRNPFKIQIMQTQAICTCRPVTCQQRDCRHATGDTARGNPSCTRGRLLGVGPRHNFRGSPHHQQRREKILQPRRHRDASPETAQAVSTGRAKLEI